MASSASRRSIHGASDFLEQTIAAAKKFGIRHSLLDTGEIRSRFPQFNLTGGERGYYEPAMGFLRPESCVESQLLLAERAGAEIRKNEKVLDVAQAATEVHLHTSAGRYTADQVVLTAGPWVKRFLGNELSPLLEIYRQTLHWFDLNDSLDSYLAPRFPVFIWEFGRDSDDFVYGFPAIDGPHGGIKVATEQHVSETDPDSVERTVSEQENAAIFDKYIRQRLPGVSSRSLKATVCLYTSAPGSRFIIDRLPSSPNILLVSPCSGHGFKHSAAIGEAVSELVTVGKSRIDLSKFKL